MPLEGEYMIVNPQCLITAKTACGKGYSLTRNRNHLVVMIVEQMHLAIWEKLAQIGIEHIRLAHPRTPTSCIMLNLATQSLGYELMTKTHAHKKHTLYHRLANPPLQVGNPRQWVIG